MQIANLLIKNLKVNTDLGIVAPSKATNKESFENCIKDISSKQSNAAGKEKSITADKSNVERKDKAKKPDGATKDKSKKTETKKIKEEKPETKKVDVEKTDEAMAAIIASISEELKIPPEVVEEILAQLDITVSDLSEAENLSAFMQGVYNAETPMELLNVPDISEKLSEIRNILNATEGATSKKGRSIEIASNVIDEQVVLESVDAGLESSLKAPAEKFFEQVSVASENETTKTDNTTNATNNTEQSGSIEMSIQTDVSSSNTNEFNFEQDNQQNVMLNLTSPGVRSTTVSTAELRTLTAQSNTNVQDVVNQITESLKTNVKEGITEIKVVLKPEQLGDVTLRVVSENGIITAKFIAESERVKEIIEANFNDLKDTLQKQGLNISELSVSVGQENLSDNMQRFLSEKQKSNARIRQIINNISGEIDNEAIDTTQEIMQDSSINYTA